MRGKSFQLVGHAFARTLDPSAAGAGAGVGANCAASKACFCGASGCVDGCGIGGGTCATAPNSDNATAGTISCSPCLNQPYQTHTQHVYNVGNVTRKNVKLRRRGIMMCRPKCPYCWPWCAAAGCLARRTWLRKTHRCQHPVLVPVLLPVLLLLLFCKKKH